MTTSTIARQEDGTVQLTITIPQNEVKKVQNKALEELVKEVEVPGFRKGKAPKDVAQKHISSQTISERVLGKLLPEAYSRTIKEHKIKPILAPRFELLSVESEKDWQIRAITCEFPKIELGDYKKEILGKARAKDIWVPGKDPSTGSGQAKQPSREEKEQEVLKTLLDTVKVSIPRLLIEEEVNHRLSHLIDQTQKLGLTVEQYLASVGKTPESVREDYKKAAQTSIKLELILNTIAQKEDIQVEEKEVDEIISSTGDEEAKKSLSAPQQRSLIKSVLKRRKILDSLVSLL